MLKLGLNLIILCQFPIVTQSELINIRWEYYFQQILNILPPKKVHQGGQGASKRPPKSYKINIIAYKQVSMAGNDTNIWYHIVSYMAMHAALFFNKTLNFWVHCGILGGPLVLKINQIAIKWLQKWNKGVIPSPYTQLRVPDTFGPYLKKICQKVMSQ